MKRYGYHRTSTREQHLDRGITEINAYCTSNNLELEKIFTDQQTGKNFNRPRYTIMKEDVLRAGDELIITEVDRLGRNKQETLKELQYYRDNGIRVKILELPTTLMDLSTMDNTMARMIMETINNMFIELYATMAQAEIEKKEKRQKEGILEKKKRGEWDDYGRPSAMKLEDFANEYSKVTTGELRPFELMRKLGMSKALFDLTNLQREANRRLGYTAQQTLDYTQSLYEKKLVSYPRTDSRFLTEDMEASLPGLIAKVEKIAKCEATAEKNFKAVINGKKVSDHHAIIPTASVDKANLEELPSGEREVLKLIATRLLEAVSAPCRYMETVIDADCNGHQFKAKGKQVIDEGWKAIAPSKKSDKDEDNDQEISASINAGEKLKINSKECKEGKTSAPKPFTDVIHFESRQWKYSKCKGAG